MATFKTQIEDITGSVGDDAALNQWLTDGAKEIVNILPPELREKCATISVLTNSSSTLDMDAGGKILQVTRLSADSGGYQIPCREIPPMYGGLAEDNSNLMYYATVSDPLYWVTSNASGVSTLFVKPTPEATQVANVYRVAYPDVGGGDSVIANFPNEAEYLVVLYGAVKALQRLQNNFQTNTDIDTTAFTAVNTELDETQVVCDLINTQVDSAVSEIAEAATEVDAQIDTACDAITTAAGRVNTAVALANGQFDAGVLEAAQAEGEADDAAIATALTAVNTNIDSAVAEIVLAKAEAAEIATQTDEGGDFETALDAINTELDKVDEICTEANTEFDKCTALLDLGETDTEGAVNTAAAKIITEMDETQSVCDKIDADLVLAKAEIVLAKAEAAELATQTDNGGDFETACDAMATELNKVDNIILEASTEFDKVDNVIIEGSVEIDKSTALLDLGETDSEGAVNTAAAKIITELDETQSICDKIDADLVLAKAEIVLAKAEAAELATQTDNSGDIETALDAINTALDKFRADGGDPALFGDETQYLTGVGLAHAKDALELARDAVDTGFTTDEDSGSGDDATPKSVGYWLDDEDTEMAQATLQTAQTEIQRAQAHIAEWNATVQALLGEANGFTKEAQARVAFSGAKGQAVQSYIATATSYIQSAKGFEGEVQSKINIANGYIAEITIRLQQASTKRQESKSRLEAGNSYLKEAQLIVSQGNAYIAEAQSYIAQAQGYAAEVGARAGFSSAKVKAVQGHISTSQSYVATAQGFSGEVQSKIAISQGYVSEINVRLSQAKAKREESTSRVESGSAYLKEVQGRIAQANGYAQEVSARGGFTQAKFQAVQSYINTAGAYIQAANGFANEVKAYASSVGIFKLTSENRINLGNAFLAEANASAQEAQTYVAEVSARVAQIGGYGQVVDGYIKSAQGYASEIQSKIVIAQGYIAEANTRMARDEQKYKWFQVQQLKLQQDYDKGIQMLVSQGIPKPVKQERAK